MFCSQCGERVQEGDYYCRTCGTLVGTSDGQPDGQEIPEPHYDAQQTVAHPIADSVLGAEPEKLGPYYLRGELGRGAMAKVWRAWDPKLEREVAIKEPLVSESTTSAELDAIEERFVNEARTAAKLEHPGVVRVYAADVYDNRPVLVMELLEGCTLRALLKNGPLRPVDAITILDQLLDAVGTAHQRGIVHRDIKPENIFLNGNLQVKLGDFGIAKAEGESTAFSTMPGMVFGTPAYMSPEQSRGLTTDLRSDLFSIGVVAYEMLTGQNPLIQGMSVLGMQDGGGRRSIEPLPDWVCTGLEVDPRPAIMMALADDPADRHQSAAAFKKALHAGAETVRHKNVGLPSHVIIGVACVIALLIIAGSFALRSCGEQERNVSTPITSSASGPDGIEANEAVRYYLGVNDDGYIAVFCEYSDGSDSVEWVSETFASDLDSSDREWLDDKPEYGSKEKAVSAAKELAEVEEIQLDEEGRITRVDSSAG